MPAYTGVPVGAEVLTGSRPAIPDQRPHKPLYTLLWDSHQKRKFSRETACLPRKPGTTDTSWSHHGSSQRLYPPSHRHTRPHTPTHTNTHPALSRSALPPNPCDRDRCNSRSDDTKLSAAPGWVVHQGYPPGARPPRPNQGAVPLPGRGESGAPWVGAPIWCSISQGWLLA